MNYPNILEFQSDFEQGDEKLGQGTYGVVYKLKSKRILNQQLEKHLEGIEPFPGQWFAVKTMEAESLKHFPTIQREFLILKTLPIIHPHIITLYKSYAWVNISQSCSLVLAMELADHSLQEEIKRRIETKCPFQDSEIMFLLQQCINTLAEILNVYKILHRDIKPENILLQKGLQVKLTDFGVSKKLLQKKLSIMPGTLVGTPSYLSPKLWEAFSRGAFKSEKISKIMHNLEKSDIYSLGISLLQVALLLPPSEINPLNKGERGQIATNQLIGQIENQRFRDILSKMLIHDEQERANYQLLLNLLQEPLYKGINNKKKEIFKEYQSENIIEQFSIQSTLQQKQLQQQIDKDN